MNSSAAPQLGSWSAYGGAHFLGTGTYTAETPEEARKLMNDIIASTGGDPKRKRRWSATDGWVLE